MANEVAYWRGTRRRLLTCEGPPRASPRAGHLGPVPLGVFAEGAHVPGALDEADTRGYASCARASSGVFARTEQHVGQFTEGTPSRNTSAWMTSGGGRGCLPFSPLEPWSKELSQSTVGWMKNTLDVAHTWFFESSHQHGDGTLIIRLVEGIKGAERKYVEIGDTKLGPYFPVEVLARSRVARIVFPDADVCFSFGESFDCPDPQLVREPGRFLYSVSASAFRAFAGLRTTVDGGPNRRHHEYLLWCEDRIFQILSSGVPEVSFEAEGPDLTTARTATWSSN